MTGREWRALVADDVLRRFGEYRAEHSTWGSLHLVLEDGNYRDEDVQFCLGYAEEHGDVEGVALARLLLGMSAAQRSQVACVAALAPATDAPTPGERPAALRDRVERALRLMIEVDPCCERCGGDGEYDLLCGKVADILGYRIVKSDDNRAPLAVLRVVDS